jgi:hypothetical protein
MEKMGLKGDGVQGMHMDVKSCLTESFVASHCDRCAVELPKRRFDSGRRARPSSLTVGLGRETEHYALPSVATLTNY